MPSPPGIAQLLLRRVPRRLKRGKKKKEKKLLCYQIEYQSNSKTRICSWPTGSALQRKARCGVLLGVSLCVAQEGKQSGIQTSDKCFHLISPFQSVPKGKAIMDWEPLLYPCLFTTQDKEPKDLLKVGNRQQWSKSSKQGGSCPARTYTRGPAHLEGVTLANILGNRTIKMT